MKILRHTTFIILFCWSLLHAGGRYAGASLELGAGARPLSLGSAAVAMHGRGETFYYNPASLALLEQTHINAMYAPTFGSLKSPMATYNYAGAAFPLQTNTTLAVNWTRFAVDDIPVYPDLKGESFADRNNNLELRPDGTALGYLEDVEDVYYFTFAKDIGFIFPLGWWYGDVNINIPFGMNFKMIRQKLGKHTATGMGVDVGGMMKFSLAELFRYRPLGELALGLSVTDMSTTAIVWDTEYKDHIHSTVAAGMAYYHIFPSNAKMNLFYTFYRKYRKQQLYGCEFIWKNIALRLGTNRDGLTAGAGAGWGRFHFDYAFVANSFQDVHRLSCSFSF